MVDEIAARLTGRRPARDDSPPSAHLIGVAGSGMQSLAEVLLDCRWRLSGSDHDHSALRNSILAAAPVYRGHDGEQVPDSSDLVIHSAAVPAENVERRRAVELGIPTMSYPKAVARIANGSRGVAVAGTHGKSTTVAMTEEILRAAGIDPTVIAGGLALNRATGGRAGRDDLTLVEACEYRRHFLHLRPAAAVVLSMEHDHFDCYRTWPQWNRAFVRFAGRVRHDGLLLVPFDCPHSRAAAGASSCRVETFGFDRGADWQAAELTQARGRWLFLIRHRGRPVARVRLEVPGRHNVLNALAAAVLGHWCGAGDGAIRDGLRRFAGLARRLESLGTTGGVTWIDDYAHHPTEVTASLEAVREMHPRRRVWCVFQPHQASRTGRLLDEFAHSLQNADKIVVAEVFRARESAPRPGDATAADLAAVAVRLGADVADVHTAARIQQHLREHVADGDVVITMGAGDIGKVRHELVGWLRGIRSAGRLAAGTDLVPPGRAGGVFRRTSHGGRTAVAGGPLSR